MQKKVYDLIGLDNPTINAQWHMLQDTAIVQSFSDNSVDYLISPRTNSCACKDFTNTRTHFKLADPRRCCKHLALHHTQSGLVNSQSELTQIVMKSKARGPYMATMQFREGMIFTVTFEDKGWKNLFSRRRRAGDPYLGYTGQYAEYGYNQSWSYGVAPPGGRVLRDAIYEIKEYIVASKMPKYIL